MLGTTLCCMSMYPWSAPPLRIPMRHSLRADLLFCCSKIYMFLGAKINHEECSKSRLADSFVFDVWRAPLLLQCPYLESPDEYTDRPVPAPIRWHPGCGVQGPPIGPRKTSGLGRQWPGRPQPCATMATSELAVFTDVTGPAQRLEVTLAGLAGSLLSGLQALDLMHSRLTGPAIVVIV